MMIIILKQIQNTGVRLCVVPLGTEAIRILLNTTAWSLRKISSSPRVSSYFSKHQAENSTKIWIASVPSGTSQRRRSK
jgi:hypothetical protein